MRTAFVLCLSAALLFAAAAAGAPSAALDPLLGNYYKIQKSLAADSLGGVSASASEIAKLGRQAASAAKEGKAQLLAVTESAAKLNAADLKSARNGFGDLSEKLIAYLKASHAATNPPYQYYCPMVKKNWLQPEKGVQNPYYGKSMLTCGELVQPGSSAGHP